jgi:hypothetical protein
VLWHKGYECLDLLTLLQHYYKRLLLYHLYSLLI